MAYKQMAPLGGTFGILFLFARRGRHHGGNLLLPLAWSLFQTTPQREHFRFSCVQLHFSRIVFRFVKMVFGGLFALAMSSNVFVCQIHLCLRLLVPRAASRDQHAAVKWCATNPQRELESVKRLHH
jgi:hypothetical protein